MVGPQIWFNKENGIERYCLLVSSLAHLSPAVRWGMKSNNNNNNKRRHTKEIMLEDVSSRNALFQHKIDYRREILHQSYGGGRPFLSGNICMNPISWLHCPAVKLSNRLEKAENDFRRYTVPHRRSNPIDSTGISLFNCHAMHSPNKASFWDTHHSSVGVFRNNIVPTACTARVREK